MMICLRVIGSRYLRREGRFLFRPWVLSPILVFGRPRRGVLMAIRLQGSFHQCLAVSSRLGSPNEYRAAMS
jgi:hypothetical protein